MFRNQVDGAGKAQGIFELAAETSLPIELAPGQMAIGEPRRKGSPELLINMKPPAGNSQLYSLALAADGRSLTTTKLTVDTLVQGTTLLLRDLNQDGLAEALMLEPEKGLLSVSSWAQQSGGRTRSFYLGVTASGLTTGLVDADALPDVAVVTKMIPMQASKVGLSVSYGLSVSELQ